MAHPSAADKKNGIVRHTPFVALRSPFRRFGCLDNTREQQLSVRYDQGCWTEAIRTSENAVKAKFLGELTYPIALTLMLQVAGRVIGHSLRSADISLHLGGHPPSRISIHRCYKL
jgi:hypothetical protein